MRALHPLLLAAVTFASAATAAQHPPRAEAQLRHVFDRLAQGRLNDALGEADRLVAAYPNFRLAHLLRGDLLLARAQPIAGLGNGAPGARERLEELRAEAAVRLRAPNELPPADSVPRHLLQLAPTQRHAIVVDASRSRVYVYENAGGVPRLVENYYSTRGKRGIEKVREGDQKTPIGVYHVTSSIPGRKLPDLYGWGAFPLSYPNEWDRLQGRTGYGIWIHGVPTDTYARAPQASDGCIALANPEIEQLAKLVQPGLTPVIITKRTDWVAADAWRAERDAFLLEVESWRADWESRDAERYLAHYAAGFRSDGMNLERWRAHKRRVNAGKSWIKVSLSNVSAFLDPSAEPLMVVTFDQDYRSSNLSQKARKRQYWVQEGGRWKIAYEAAVGRPVLMLPESFPRARGSSAAQSSGR
ncbi:MAG: L,D-transpeptidase Cds6 family protein [Woeseiaceae bacterium]